MDTNSFINQVKSYRKSTLDKALQLNSFANGGPTNQIPPYITSDYDEYVSRKRAYADSLAQNQYYNDFQRMYQPNRTKEEVLEFAGKYHDFLPIDKTKTSYPSNVVGYAGDHFYGVYGVPEYDVEGDVAWYHPMKPKSNVKTIPTKPIIAANGDGVWVTFDRKPVYSPKPKQQVIYQEKPKTYNYEVSREVQYPNTQSARIWRILTNNNEYNLNPNEEDYPVDPRYKGINDTVTEAERNAWNQRFNIEPYTKEMTEEEAAELEKQGFTVKKKNNGGPIRQFQAGGPTENVPIIDLPTATVTGKPSFLSPGWWNKTADKLDNFAFAAGFVPVVGDAASFLADVGANFARYQYDKSDPTLPEWQRKDIAKANLKSGLGLAGAAALIGLIPGVSMPSGNIKNAVKKGMKSPKQMTKNELISAYNTEIKKPSDQWDMDYLESLKKEYDKMSAEGTKAIDAEGYPVDLYHSGPEVDKFHQFDVDHDGHESMVYGTTDPIVSKTYIYKENENLPGLTDIQYVPDDYSNTEHLTKRWHFYPESVLEVEGKGSPWNRIGITDDLKNAVDLQSDLSKKYLLPLHQSEEYKKAGLTKKHMLERPIRQKISDLMRPELNKLGFQSEENLMNYYARQFRENPLYGKTTRGIEDYAKHLTDKEGVIIHNIVDLGSPIPEVYNHSGLSDIYAISDPRRVKLADAVTFDEAGKPIELQYRNDFTKNNDLYGIVPPALLIGTGAAAYNRFTKDKQQYALGGPIRQFQEGGPTENYFGELLPTVTVHPQDNTRVSNIPYINPVYDEDSNKYLTGRPYALYAKELGWNDYIDNGYFFGINPNEANKHFTDSPKGAFLKAYEMNPNIDRLYGYISEHLNDYDRFGDNNPKPLDLNLTNGKINKTLQGRTITEDLKNSIQSAAKKYNVDPYDILAHFFLEANDTIIDNNTYPNLHNTRYLQIKKQSPALGEFFINPEEKDLAANMKILQKDGTYDQQKLMEKVSEELPKLKNIPVSESYADEVAWMIANGHRDFNPKQKGYRAPKGKINHSYIEMLDDAIPILKQTKLFD